MNSKPLKCKKCNYVVLAYRSKYNPRFKSNIVFFNMKNNYEQILTCPSCGEFLHRSIGADYDKEAIRII
jgi:hypothetical protein